MPTALPFADHRADLRSSFGWEFPLNQKSPDEDGFYTYLCREHGSDFRAAACKCRGSSLEFALYALGDEAYRRNWKLPPEATAAAINKFARLILNVAERSVWHAPKRAAKNMEMLARRRYWMLYERYES